MTTPSVSDLKERERSTWAGAAEGWKRRDELLTKGAIPVTERMLALAAVSPGHHVLDIASGTGEPAISAAHIVGDSGSVTGSDLVEEMLVHAREKAAKANLNNIAFHCVDGETLTFTPDTYDVVTIRWGLMFMPEPHVCLALAHTAMKTGGRIALACWAAPDENPFLSLLVQTLSKYMEIPKPPPGTPGIFAFADPDRLRNVIETAGFKNVELEKLEFNIIELESGLAYWEAMSDLAAPIMLLVNKLDDEQRASFVSDVIAAADALKEGDTLRLRGTTWLVAADK